MAATSGSIVARELLGNPRQESPVAELPGPVQVEESSARSGWTQYSTTVDSKAITEGNFRKDLWKLLWKR
jgi:hypothetical protein